MNDRAYKNLCVEVKRFAHYLDQACPDGSEKALSLIQLGNVLYWAVAALEKRNNAPEIRSQQEDHLAEYTY